MHRIDLEAAIIDSSKDEEPSCEANPACYVNLTELSGLYTTRLGRDGTSLKSQRRLYDNGYSYDYYNSVIRESMAEKSKESKSSAATPENNQSYQDTPKSENDGGKSEPTTVKEAYQGDGSDVPRICNSSSSYKVRRVERGRHLGEEWTQQRRGDGNLNPQARDPMPHYMPYPMQPAPGMPYGIPYYPQMSIPTQIPTSPQTQIPSQKVPSQSAEPEAIARQENFKTPKLPELDFHDRLAAAGIKNLYQRSPPGEPLSYNIALNTLQRMVLHELQGQLVGTVREIVQNQEVQPDFMENARKLLGKYTTAIRHYDYMTEKLAQTSAAGEEDPFLITTKDILGYCLMKDNHLIPENDDLKPPEPENARKVVLPGPPRNGHDRSMQWSRLLERLSMGVCGGVALIAPMLLMVLHNDQVTALATTSVATMFFAVGLAFLGKNLRGQEVLGAVAAYAAVLVVFVGATTGRS